MNITSFADNKAIERRIKMELVSGDMLWTNITPIPRQYPSLTDHHNTEVLVLGGGVTGALAAYFACKAGFKTTLIEKNMIALGSTKATTSILQYEIDTDFIGLKDLIGEEKAWSCFKYCHDTVYILKDIIKEIKSDCDFTLKDCLYYTNNSSMVKNIQKEFELRKKYGLKVDYIDKEKGKDMFSFPLEAGIYSRSGAGTMNPFKFTHDLVYYCSEHLGLQVFENTESKEINPTKKDIYITTTNDFKIKAHRAIIAEGYESTGLIRRSLGQFGRTFTIVTRPLKEIPHWHNTCIVRDNEDPYTYFRTTADNRIMFGGGDLPLGGWDSKMAHLQNTDAKAIEVYDMLERRMRDYFPDIKDLEVEFKFSGIFSDTKDGLPLVGEDPSIPHAYFTLGYGSNGILFGLMGGQLIAEKLKGKNSPFLDLYRLGR